MGIDRRDFEQMVKRVVRGRERRLNYPESLKPIVHPKVRTDNLAYNPQVVTAWLKTYQIPEPSYEYHFNSETKHRFDLAWPECSYPVALEVQGGIYSMVKGAHVRGAALEREWIKLNLAASLGWRVLFCSPEQLMTAEIARSIKTALFWVKKGEKRLWTDAPRTR